MSVNSEHTTEATNKQQYIPCFEPSQQRHHYPLHRSEPVVAVDIGTTVCSVCSVVVVDVECVQGAALECGMCVKLCVL